MNRIKKLPIIRHIRWLILSQRVFHHAETMRQLGLGLGEPNPSDLKHLDNIWEGKA